MTPEESAQERKNAIMYVAVGGVLFAAGAAIWVLTNNAVAGIIAALLGASAEGAGVRKLLNAQKKP